MRYLIILTILLSGCITQRIVTDGDDLYPGNRRDSVRTVVRYRYISPDYNYYTPNYGWWGYSNPYYRYPYYQPRTIIVVPKTETPKYDYGKRPDRSGGNGGVDIPLNRRRGRQ